jgi:hypothetical protein
MGVLGFDCRRGLGMFFFITASRIPMEPTQPPTQWVSGTLSLGVKRPGSEADHSPPPSAEVKECVKLYLHSQYAFTAWCLVKHRDNFTFTFHNTHFSSILSTRQFLSKNVRFTPSYNFQQEFFDKRTVSKTYAGWTKRK